MEKVKYYYHVRFPARIVEEAHDLFLRQLDRKKDEQVSTPNDMSVTLGDETWSFDSREEFLAEYPKADGSCLDHITHGCRLRVRAYPDRSTYIGISLPTRMHIEGRVPAVVRIGMVSELGIA